MEKKKLSELIPNPDNPRVIKTDKFYQLVESVKNSPTFLKHNKIAVDEDMMILAGNQRYRAALEAKMKSVPVTIFTREDAEENNLARKAQGNPEATYEEQCIEYVIKDNAHNGEWDWDIVGNELSDYPLAEWGLDVWQPEFEPADGLTDADDVPAVPEEPKTKLGDLYILGDHRLLCGDSTQAEDVEKLMNGEKADALITDPPYGINANNQTLGSGKKQFYRGGDWDKSRPNISEIINLASTQIIWGGNYFSDVLSPTNDWLCWHKKNDGLSFSEFELAWTNIGKNCRLLSHHWGGENKLHPTMKPVAVMEWCINMTQGIIIDPFLGSGSTFIAAEKTNRKCYGIELDPKYCDVIIKRWEDFTGKKATLSK